jgi:hypothetical protein
MARTGRPGLSAEQKQDETDVLNCSRDRAGRDGEWAGVGDWPPHDLPRSRLHPEGLSNTQRMNICLGLLAATRIGVIHGFA